MTAVENIRYKILKAMDATVRECVCDEDYYDTWSMVGIPDGASDSDYCDWAQDEEDYLEFVDAFGRLMSRLDADPDEWSKEDIIDVFIQNL